MSGKVSNSGRELANERAIPAVLLFSGVCIILVFPLVAQATLLWAAVRMFVYVAPGLLTVRLNPGQAIRSLGRRVEVTLIVAIIILGLINIALSDVPRKTLLHMTIFLSTGILVAWTSMLIFRTAESVHTFDRFCSLCLAIIIPVEILAFVMGGIEDSRRICLFTGNAIPTGTLAILLSAGPISMLESASRRIRLVGMSLIAGAFYLIILTQRRGALLAALIMAVVWTANRRPKLVALPLIGLAILAILAPIRQIPLSGTLNPNIGHHFSILNRIELYSFALHVFKKHPLFGLGLRTNNHEDYLTDYQLNNQDLTRFPDEVRRIHTFDNMILTLLVECGSLFTIFYLGLIGFILHRFLKSYGGYPVLDGQRIHRVLPLLGLAVHSMFYDSLLFPSINWLFHVHLGILAALPYDPGDTQPKPHGLSTAGNHPVGQAEGSPK